MSTQLNGFENDLEPTEFYLSPNYPNPFKEKTVIKYCIACTTRVKLTVFDSEGKEIIRIVDEVKNPGTYEIFFQSAIDGGKAGRQLPIGTYYYQLEAGDYKSEMKMELIR